METTGEETLVSCYGQYEKLSYFDEWKPDVLRNTEIWQNVNYMALLYSKENSSYV